MDFRRRRILIGVFVALVLAGLGVAAAYALSTHTTPVAQTADRTSAMAEQPSTGQTAADEGTSAPPTTAPPTTAAQTTARHHHHHHQKTATTPVGQRTVSTVTTQPATTGHHQNELPKPLTISDAFEGNLVNPSTWSKVEDGNDVLLVEQGGQLQLTVGASAVPAGHQNLIDVHVATQCAFPGNFDARVSYALLEWPPGDNIDVGMNANGDAAAVMRDNSSQSDDGYTSWVGKSNRSVPFSSKGGSLRIARVDGIETTYFWHGVGWQKLARFRQIGSTVLGLQAVSDGQNSFGGMELKVAFDNFKVTGANPVCN